ncbi:MAG: phosphoenolpyruvate carboxykinase [Culicoidibacterales bacterium]
MSFIFELGRDTAVLNFTAQYCETKVEVLESVGFEKVLLSYLAKIKKRDTPTYQYLLDGRTVDIEAMQGEMQQLFKLLLVLDPNEIIASNTLYKGYLVDHEAFIGCVEEIYSYWRKLGRYAIAYNAQYQKGIQNTQFIETHARFSALILTTYRVISEKIKGSKNRVYRQLIAGVNAGLVVNKTVYPLTDQLYSELFDIPMIESIVLHPPFITYPKKNTRKGIFNEVFENPLKGIELEGKDYFCYPAKVGDLMAFVYFHKDFMAQGVTLCNLFELADLEEAMTTKPDLIYVYGVPDGKEDTVFYKDEANDMYIGYASYSENIDYFGYMKKMILTIHNVKMIDQKALPLHGAMANIMMTNGKTKNIIIIGDSGAGKSETLEALRTIGEQYIKDIKIIFDDMGVLSQQDNSLVAHGTEIGAFVRLDDLDVGYAYKEIDRSIFMNPDRINARIVIPVATYEEITKKYPIDLFLYANNYEATDALSFFDNGDDALAVFKAGARIAKGTTSEIGLVETYFANPFGPVQRQEQTDVLLDEYFAKLASSTTKMGQIRTKLGIPGNEHSGPKQAAISLLEYLQEM